MWGFHPSVLSIVLAAYQSGEPRSVNLGHIHPP